MVISIADETRRSVIAPLSLGEVEEWAAEHETDRDDALQRFAQFAVLASVADDAALRDQLVLRGAGALRLFYEGPRATADLDFIAAPLQHYQPDDGDKARWAQRVRAALLRGLPRHFTPIEQWRGTLSRLVKVHVSPNIMLCEARQILLSEVPSRAIFVYALEEILADKLVAILQQAERNRERKQDVFDIAACVRRYGVGIDLDRVARYFEAKCRVDGVPPRRAAFSNVAHCSAIQYEMLRAQTGRHFIPFDDAWAVLSAFVNSLPVD